MFTSNTGLNTEWHLPSEPSITQIFAGDHLLSIVPTLPPTNSPHEYQGVPEQTLSRLPAEREAIGTMIF